jgi:hypothetical protein
LGRGPRDPFASGQGEEAGGALDAIVVSSVPSDRSLPATERARVHLGNPWRWLVLALRIQSCR